MNRFLARSVEDVPVRDIIVSKANTRAYYNEEELEGLTDSVSKIGQIFPVVVRPINATKYELIIGTRRYKAAEKRQAQTISAFVISKDVNDKDVTILALSENLHRQDLTPFEEAKAILKLCKDFKMDPAQVAQQLGKDVDFVRGRLKILSLPESVQTMVCKKEGVTLSHVGVLGSIKKPRDQIRYAKMVVKDRLSKDDLVTVLREKFTPPAERQPSKHGKYWRTPRSMALKLKRLRNFLKERVEPMLEPGKPGIAEITTELGLLRKTINDLLAGEKEKVQK